MTYRSGSGGLGLISVIAVAATGVVFSLAVGLVVWAVLNSWLAIEWVRGFATLAAGVVVAGALVREVILTTRVRLHLLRKSRRNDR
ncbi:MAG TPA: hypothetical protein VF494_02090 [Candidatus Limnocylindrales bacterium]